MCLLSARLPATHAECIRNAKSLRKRKTLHHRDNICHLSTNRGKIKATLVRISYLGEGEKPNNFPGCCLEQRLLADARAVIRLHIWASVTECDSERQGEGKTRLHFSCSRMTGCRLDTRLADGISKSFHEPSGMCTMITNHTYNKARRVASQGGWGERAGGKKGGKEKKTKRCISKLDDFSQAQDTKNSRHLPAGALPPPETTARLLRSMCAHNPAPPELSADKPQIVITSPIINET